MKKELINQASLGYFLKYIFTSESLFRRNQNEFLRIISDKVEGSIIEIGAEGEYKHNSYFSKIRYFATNINKSGANYLDVTKISKENNSVDNYLCISVLEHVKNINEAIFEIHRTLKPVGRLYLVVPFGYAVHDTKDYWRLAPDSYFELFHNYEIEYFYHLGGKLSTCAEALQRPRGKITIRYFFYKLVGWVCLFLAVFFERADDFPLGYGLILRKK